jgi:hypothetical protein
MCGYGTYHRRISLRGCSVYLSRHWVGSWEEKDSISGEKSSPIRRNEIQMCMCPDYLRGEHVGIDLI